MPSSRPAPAAVEALLSPARLQPYRNACGGRAAAAVELYEWNIAVSAAFWEIIVVLEMAMRNAVHDRLSDAYGPTWYDNPSILDDRSLNAIRDAKRRAARGLHPKPSSPSPGKVVGELSFGAWVALLDRGGESTALGGRVRYHDTLWLPALRSAFPHGPGHQRKTNRGLRTVQTLRNRIGHHEKIFKEPFRNTQLTLSGLHDHCIEVTGWVSADAAAWAQSFTRVPALLLAKPVMA